MYDFSFQKLAKADGERLSVSGSISINIGSPPQYLTAFAVATKVSDCVMI